MSDSPVRTIVETNEGELAFQEYFVHRRCKPKVTGFRFEGIQGAKPTTGLLKAVQKAEAVVICPSNPWVSIGPILAVPGLRPALEAKRIAAVSPIIGGKAVKGPAAKMYRELGIQPTALAVAEHYQRLISDFVLDRMDVQLEAHIQRLNVRTLSTQTLMQTSAERQQLAQDVLNFIGTTQP